MTEAIEGSASRSGSSFGGSLAAGSTGVQSNRLSYLRTDPFFCPPLMMHDEPGELNLAMTFTDDDYPKIPQNQHRPPMFARTQPSRRHRHSLTDQVGNHAVGYHYNSQNHDTVGSPNKSSCKLGQSRIHEVFSVLFFIPALVLLGLTWYPAWKADFQIHTLEIDLESAATIQHRSLQQLDALSDSIRSFNGKIQDLQEYKEKFLEDLRQDPDIHVTLSLDDGTYHQMEEKENVLLERISLLERDVQHRCARNLEEQFGSGPYQVKFLCTDISGAPLSFTVELPNAQEMPHTTNYFLELVESNLWEGLTLMGGGENMTSDTRYSYVVASPMKMDWKRGHHMWVGERFSEHNLTSLAFSERTDPLSERKQRYPLSFSGHPGGPSFQIDLEMGNSQSAAFGYVVEGFEVLDRFRIKGHDSHSVQILTITSMSQVKS